MASNDGVVKATGKTGKNAPKNWVVNYADYLYSYALARISDEELARDLVQETFLAGLENRDKFEGRSSEKTWLTGILKHKIIDIYRKRSSIEFQDIRAEAAEDATGFFDPSDGHWLPEHRPQAFQRSADDPLLRKEFDGILKECLQKLPGLWYSVFKLKHLDEEKTEFICKELRLTPANFWVIIHRAKVNLRACLQKNWI